MTEFMWVLFVSTVVQFNGIYVIEMCIGKLRNFHMSLEYGLMTQTETAKK